MVQVRDKEPTEIDNRSREADIDAIKQVVATVQHATQNELVEEFLALFRADAIWTTGGGKPLFGLDEISAFTRQVLPGGMTGLTITMDVTHVLFIRPDVAAVKIRQIYTSSDGQPSDAEGEGTPMFVMAKDDDKWRLVACQNTGVPESQ
ncbi:MAG: SgcJ/EcaC family oxidoreductase [Pseudonocardiaceae bacterium]|nr:SgcJ/EcaC family oxidoreductase [Pseudonocardiaceae bacterium]